MHEDLWEEWLVTDGEHIVRGISLDAAGQATIAPSLIDVLFDLALELEATGLPVDVQHVVAALVLAVRTGELAPDTEISADDPLLLEILTRQIRSVFAAADGRVGRDD